MFLDRSGRTQAALPPAPPARQVLLAGFGSMLAIAAIAGLGDLLSAALVLGSFGASSVLVFGFPEVPFSQPRNVLLGHCLSSLIGLLFLHFLGGAWWSMALAVGTAVAVMMATRTVHPPAGSNPVIVFLAQPQWSFLLMPTLVGALLLIVVAFGYNNLRGGAYPKYW